MLEDHRVARLGRAVRGEERVACVRGQRHCDERRGAGNEPVERHGHATGGAGEGHADEAGDLEAADLGEDVQAIARVGSVHRERATDDVHLAGDGRIVHAGAAARHALGQRAGDRRGDRARRRGVADSHLAGGEKIGSRVERVLGESRARLDRAHGLRARHRGAARHVGGAGRDRARVELRRAGDRVGHTEVGDDDARPRLAREDVHGGSPAQEVLDHLRGDDLGIGAHALGDHAVVGGEDEDDRPLDPRRPAAQHGEARRDLFEPSEASGRLRQAVEVAARRREALGRRRTDRATETGEHRRAARGPTAASAGRWT